MNELTGAHTAHTATPRILGWLSRLATKRTAWGLCIAAMATATANGVFAVLSRATPRPEYHPWWLIAAESPTGLIFATLGLLAATRRPCNPAGWLLLAAGFGASLDLLSHSYGLYAVPRELSGGVLAAWISSWGFVLFIFPLMFLFLLFPNGHLSSVRWRFAARYVSVCGLISVSIGAFAPGPLGFGYFPSVSNPVGIAALLFSVTHVGLVSVFAILVPFLVSVSSLLFRYRNSTGLLRRQLNWVAWATMMTILLVAIQILVGDNPAGTIAVDLAPVLLGTAITIAILRHNLFDIDRMLSSTLIYAGLTAGVVGLYIGIVSAFGLLLQRSASGVAPLLATGVVAVVLQPLRTLLQRSVSRLVYGLRDDPYTALALLGRRMEATSDPKKILPEAAATVAEALRLPYVAIELDSTSATGIDRMRVATHGTEVREPLKLPLVHQSEEIGLLMVGLRPLDERFSAADLRLLRDVARHVAQAASAVRLSLALLSAQEHAVAAAAEERRRLARDLHDRVGPVLTGATWTLQAALTKLHTDLDATHGLLTTALVHMRQGTEDLRRISTGLRSPVDQLGLREAVLIYLERVPLTVHPALPDEIPRLPAATEEAAYWIVAEAVANVLRHAHADNCWVTVELGGALVLTVADDGRGLPDRFRPGVGMGSMRERAAEIGGTCQIHPRAGQGTEVVTRLPPSLPGAETQHSKQTVKGGIT
ncbi:Sensor histidine kinase LiaS (plasmid) [Streptomyces sp. YIM 121038]|uniref:sensor histidine kinase n=1 Tax=Streptomyces sp. YIM 121038 TaxID=2136401 RepID=UPI001110EC8C|nr:GAF domain-containing sensor histidine kinase [Streptomyces sp. YIM 121038]QCX73718.1 Sensor histidine kinase LiaS [Streptomyces sp. YIM 121038]QCX82101.1 Sensor histidine kinase LiaS [Streptomyces sp. YIM 121038]QCX82130.1 Sensor histidine kinase LiaS [Streptomyces sp. YIM 121038]QCX82968.1 Sensor histidine kinase LiaS [Streptomyces sp. YIM 121038]